MVVEKRLWQILLFLAGLLTAFVPAYVSYDLYGRGDIREKNIELNKFLVIDPLNDLSGLGGKVSLVISPQNQSVDNIVIAKSWLKNIGRTPILPSDYHENISVNVKPPWKILAVGSADDFIGQVQFNWTRVSDTRFEAVPALLNPDDLVSVNVYLTNTKHESLPTTEKTAKPNVEWNARIVNMTSFKYAPDPLSKLEQRYWGIRVYLMGWAVPFTIGVAMLFFALYLHLLSRALLLQEMRALPFLTILGASLLSFVAAESMATYLFDTASTAIFRLSVEHWINAPWIILNTLFLVLLYVKGRRSPN